VRSGMEPDSSFQAHECRVLYTSSKYKYWLVLTLTVTSKIINVCEISYQYRCFIFNVSLIQINI
jgi:hypothetical protein